MGQSPSYQCNYGCGTDIHFDDDVKSESGKSIPLESSGEPHNCPKNPYNSGKKSTGSILAGRQKPATMSDVDIKGTLSNIQSRLKSIEDKLTAVLANNGVE
jgi:hypothetical protein